MMHSALNYNNKEGAKDEKIIAYYIDCMLFYAKCKSTNKKGYHKNDNY